MDKNNYINRLAEALNTTITAIEVGAKLGQGVLLKKANGTRSGTFSARTVLKLKHYILTEFHKELNDQYIYTEGQAPMFLNDFSDNDDDDSIKTRFDKLKRFTMKLLNGYDEKLPDEALSSQNMTKRAELLKQFEELQKEVQALQHKVEQKKKTK